MENDNEKDKFLDVMAKAYDRAIEDTSLGSIALHDIAAPDGTKLEAALFIDPEEKQNE